LNRYQLFFCRPISEVPEGNEVFGYSYKDRKAAKRLREKNRHVFNLEI